MIEDDGRQPVVVCDAEPAALGLLFFDALVVANAAAHAIASVFVCRVIVHLAQTVVEHADHTLVHDLAVRESDLKIAQAEAQSLKDVAIIEGEATVDAARMVAIAEIAKAEQITADDIKAAGWWGFLLVWANVFNKLIRPILTVALAAAALWINWLVIDKLTTGWPALSQAQQFETGMQAFAWVTAQASMAFGYWFVSRGSSR